MSRLAVLLVVLAPLWAGGAESTDLESLMMERVRVQSPVLGPGWHEGLFNRLRTKEPCYVVLTWKPRASAEAPIQIEKMVELRAVSALQAYAGPQARRSGWEGRASSETNDDSLWRAIPGTVLEANKDCPLALPSK